MRHYKRRTDKNQVEIINALKTEGFSVVDLSAVGGGVPDLLVARNKKTYLIEVKSEKGQLNQMQINFRRAWKGRIFVIRDMTELNYFVGNVK